MNAPLVLRLNALTSPMTDCERMILAEAGCVVWEIEGEDEEEILTYAAAVDAVMIISAYLRRPVVEQMARCKIISRLGTGVDKIDIDAATDCGILVTNIPDFCTDEVADHTLALLLAAARQLSMYDTAMRKGLRPALTHMHRLSTRSLGIVGYGRIGRAVASRAKAFGMTVLVNDPLLTPVGAAADGVTVSTLDDLLPVVDYLCLLCPLLPTTRGMMTLESFRRMKPSAVLVNTGRGELVIEEDLVTALREGSLRFAALDVFADINVFARGGFPTTHPLFTMPNILLTPHVAANSEEALADAPRRGAQAVVDVLSGHWPCYPVNPMVVPWFPIEVT